MKQYLILFLVLCFGLVGNPCYAQKAKPTARPRTTQVKQPIKKVMSVYKGGLVTYTFATVHPYAIVNCEDYDDNTQNGKYTIIINQSTLSITFTYQTNGKEMKSTTIKYYGGDLSEQVSIFKLSEDEFSASSLTISHDEKTGKETISLHLEPSSNPGIDKKLTSYFGRSELCNDDEYFCNVAFTNLTNVEVK